MCALFFVRSVSPRRLVLEVRSFPSPPCAVLAFCPSCVSAFFFLCLSGLTRLRPGVCVWCVCVCFFQHSFLCLQKVRASQHSSVAMVPFRNPLATASTAFLWKKVWYGLSFICFLWRKYKKVWCAWPLAGPSALLACQQCI